jgi:hypothetical protein
MGTYPGVGFFIPTHFLFAVFTQYAAHLCRAAIELKMAIEPKALRTIANQHRVGSGKIAFGKTEVINGIEQVGFAGAIGAAYAHYFFRKGMLPLQMVFELQYFDVLQMGHGPRR